MLFALSLLACTGNNADTDTAPPSETGQRPGRDPVDTTAPTFSWATPQDGAPLSGTALLDAGATDEVGVIGVRYELDGALVAELTAAPWTTPLDTLLLPNGKHDFAAIAVDAAGNEGRSSVRALVQNGDLGSVSLVSPLDGATVCGDVPIEAYSASPVEQVLLFIDEVEKEPKKDAPFFWTWSTGGRSDGAHVISVVATLPDGTLLADRITVTTQNESGSCDTLPTVRIVTPSYGAMVDDDIAVEVAAADADASVGVRLWLDDAVLVEWNTPPFTTTWDTDGVAEGAHVLTAIATDSAGQSTQTRNLVYVDTTAPRARILAPAYGEVVQGAVVVEGEVTDATGVSSATLYIDGDSVGELTAPPWEWAWDTTTAAGEVELELEAVDVAGRTARDSTLVTVDNVPSVWQTDPVGGETVGGFVTLGARATDDLALASVAWDLDGVWLDDDASTPFAGLWDTCTTPLGSYALTATATDSRGQTRTDTATINVDQPFDLEMGGPSGSLTASESLRVWTIDDEAITEVDWSVDGVEVARETVGTLDPSCSADCASLCTLFAADLDVAALADGSHTLTVHATNAAGAEVNTSTTITVNRDVDGDGFDAEAWGGTDCDDTSARVSPDETELCDGLDQDCDGAADEDFDLDLDGYFDDIGCASGDDCDDADAAVNPAAVDDCDGIDNDCDGEADVSAAPTTATGEVASATLSATVSGQLWGNLYRPSRDLTLTSFEVYVDPTDKLLFSVYEATSAGGELSLVASSTLTTSGAVGWYASGSLDLPLLVGREYLIGVGADSALGLRYERSPSLTAVAELTPSGLVKSTAASQPATLVASASSNALVYQSLNVSWVETENVDSDGDGQNPWCGDCDDADPARFVGATEACDGVDNDCDLALPADEVDADFDGDFVCDADCDDADAARYPSATELCDGIDNDCDGDVSADEADADGDGVAACWDGTALDCADTDATTLLATRYTDFDGDGYGDPTTASDACPALSGAVADGTDCDDGDASLSPAATELCDSVDNDCDGTADEGYDADADGVGACDDCDDGDAGSFPGATETCGNTADEDCDGTAPACRYEGLVSVGSADTILYGPTTDDGVGMDVGSGDFNGDGQVDVFVTAPDANYGGGSRSGGLYLVLGPITGDLTLGPSTAIRLGGESSSDAFGGDARAGDFDGDGLDDVVAGASDDDDGGTGAGAVYVIPSATVASGSVSTASYKLVGESRSDSFGESVAGGDINGDGYADVIAGAYAADGGGAASGGVWLFHGGITADMDASLADSRLTGESSSDYAGISLASGGDLTGDGLDDVVVGASGDDDGGSAAGAVYVVADPASRLDLSLADAKLTGGAASDRLGTTTPLVWDYDGDGWDDLLAGAGEADGAVANAGAVYAWFGPLSGTQSASDADAVLLGEASGDYAGASLASAGDLDGDGHPDLLVGAYLNATSGSSAGCAYLLYGPLAASVSLGSADAIFLAESIGDQLGMSMAGGADFDADGQIDFLLAANQSDLVATDAGAVYVIDGAE